MTKKTYYKSKKMKEAEILGATFDKKEVEKILGECHDGEDYKVRMKDGSIKIVSKSKIDEK